MNYGGVTLTITGSGFVTGTLGETPLLEFDGNFASSVTFIDSQTLKVTCPADLGKIGPVAVILFNGDNNSSVEADNVFRYTAPPLSFQQIANAPFSTFERPYLVDVNHDNKFDLVGIAADGSGDLAVALGNGDGTFGVVHSYPTGPTGGAKGGAGLALGDFDGDGNLDAVTATFNQSTNDDLISVLPGKSDGSFGTPIQFSVGTVAGGAFPNDVAVGKFNNDSKPDIVAVNHQINGGSISVLLNTSTGASNFSFGTATVTNAGTNPSKVVTADLNNDGFSDILIFDGADSLVLPFLNNSSHDGTFTQKPSLDAGDTVTDVTVGDVDGDGNPDLVVAQSITSGIAIYRGNGDGTFGGRQQITGGPPGNLHGYGGAGVALADLDGDGKLDLVSSGLFSPPQFAEDFPTVAVLHNLSTPGTILFDPPGRYQQPAETAGADPGLPATGDLTGDGKKEIVTGRGFIYRNTLLKQSTTTLTAAPNGTSDTRQNVTFTATVTGSGGTPGGSVSFLDGITSLGAPVTLSGGHASLSTTTLSAGTHSIYAVYNGDTTFGASTSAAFQQDVIEVDSTPPTTTAAVTSGTLGSNNWYTSSAVTVTLTAQDDPGGSGLATTYYKVDNPSCAPADTAACSTGTSVSVSGDGPHTLSYFSKDNAGNVEPQQSFAFKIDHTAPTTTAAVTTGTAGSNGWYTSASVTVTLSPADGSGGSGLAGTFYAVDNSACAPANTGACSTGTTAAVSGDGLHTVSFFSTDNAGNAEAQKSFPVKIDQTAPGVAVTGVSDGATYTYGSVPQAGCTTSDAASGVQTNAALTLTQLSGAPAHTGTFKAACAGAADKAGLGAAAVNAQYTVQPARLTITAQDASRAFGAPNPPCQVMGSGFVTPDTLASLSGTLSCDFGGATTGSPAGDYTNLPGGLSSPDYTITFKAGNLHVGVQATTLAVGSPAPVQYSDQVTFSATVSGYSAGGTTGGGHVAFTLNGAAVCGGSGQPACPTPDGSGVASLRLAELALGPSASPYAVTATYTPANSNFSGSGPSSAPTGLSVTPEDARVTYTGPAFLVATPGAASTNVLLSATVRDISAVPGDPATDAYSGDIRTATLKFVDRAHGNTVLCTPTITLVNPADSKTGTASCSAGVNLGQLSSSALQVGMVVGGNYQRDQRTDDGSVALGTARGGASAYASGALVNSRAAGSLVGGAGSATLDVRLLAAYTATPTTPNGNLTLMIAAGGKSYTVMASRLALLAEHGRQALVLCQATIVETTGGRQTLIDGAANVTISLTGAGPNTGTIAVQVWRADGSLAFASGWDGAQPVELPLAGAIVVS